MYPQIKMSANLEPVWSVGTTHLATTHPEAFIAFAWKGIEPRTTTRHSSPTTAPFAQVLRKRAADGNVVTAEGPRSLGCGGGEGGARMGRALRKGLSFIHGGYLDMH